MNQKDVDEIIRLLKNGHYYVFEDWEDSIIYRWKYLSDEKLFLFDEQDTIAGGLIKETKVSEEKFIELLWQYYKDDDFISYIYQND